MSYRLDYDTGQAVEDEFGLPLPMVLLLENINDTIVTSTDVIWHDGNLVVAYVVLVVIVVAATHVVGFC
jgi:hypothetical protein